MTRRKRKNLAWLSLFLLIVSVPFVFTMFRFRHSIHTFFDSLYAAAVTQFNFTILPIPGGGGGAVGYVPVSPSALPGCILRGDFNHDCRITLADFSILAYWYKRSGVPAEIDLSGDGRASLVDFSILAFHWSG